MEVFAMVISFFLIPSAVIVGSFLEVDLHRPGATTTFIFPCHRAMTIMSIQARNPRSLSQTVRGAFSLKACMCLLCKDPTFEEFPDMLSSSSSGGMIEPR